MKGKGKDALSARMEQNRSWRRRCATAFTSIAAAGMQAALLAVLPVGMATRAEAAVVYKQINFQWQYDTDLPELAGYVLYQDGRYLQEIHDPAVLSTYLSVGLTPGRSTLFTMRAIDRHGNQSAMSAPYRLDVPVAVENNNFLPQPRLTLSTMVGNAPLVINFSAQGSTDFDGVITSCLWEFGDGNSAMGTEVSYSYRTVGTFPVRLTVTDDQGGQMVTEQVVTVMPKTRSLEVPLAELQVAPLNPSVLQAVWFSALSSSVAGGSISACYWDFGDGQSATGAVTLHRYRLPGTYLVTLTVWDERGGSSRKSVIVRVS